MFSGLKKSQFISSKIVYTSFVLFSSKYSIKFMDTTLRRLSSRGILIDVKGTKRNWIFTGVFSDFFMFARLLGIGNLEKGDHDFRSFVLHNARLAISFFGGFEDQDRDHFLVIRIGFAFPIAYIHI